MTRLRAVLAALAVIVAFALAILTGYAVGIAFGETGSDAAARSGQQVGTGGALRLPAPRP